MIMLVYQRVRFSPGNVPSHDILSTWHWPWMLHFRRYHVIFWWFWRKGLLWNAQINIKFMLPCHQGLAWGLEWGHVTYHVSGLLCHNCQTFQSKAAARNQFCDILGFNFRTYFLDILGFHFGNPIFRHFRLPFREPIFRPQKAMPNCACCTARTIRHHRQVKMKPWWNLPSLPSGKLT